MQARYYDPLIGRFLSVDPVGFTPDKPQMFNRYAYVNNDPVNNIDPDGKACVPCVAYVVYKVGKIAHKANKVRKVAKRVKDVRRLKELGNIGKQSTKQLKQTLKTQKATLKEHKQALKDYMKDPDKFDNLGVLKKAKPEHRKEIIKGRVKELGKQIKGQKNNLKKTKKVLKIKKRLEKTK